MRQSDLSSGIVIRLTAGMQHSLYIHKGISKRQSDHSSGTIIWLTYRRNVTALQLCISVDKSDLSFAWLVGVRDSARTEDSAQTHQTLFLP